MEGLPPSAALEGKDAMEKAFAWYGRRGSGVSPPPKTTDCRCELQRPKCDHVGSTPVVAVVWGDRVIENCGISRGVLCRKGVAVPFSPERHRGTYEWTADCYPVSDSSPTWVFRARRNSCGLLTSESSNRHGHIGKRGEGAAAPCVEQHLRRETASGLWLSVSDGRGRIHGSWALCGL